MTSVVPSRSMPVPAVMLVGSLPLCVNFPSDTYRAAVASCLTLLSTTSLVVVPLALTLLAYSPWTAELWALFQKDWLLRLLEDV